MLSKQVGQSGEYISLSFQAQSLYTQIWLSADDEGFIKDQTLACRMTGTGESEIAELIHYGFIHRFESGVIVVRHWKINNQIQKDRLHPTKFVKERKQISIDENSYYQILDPNCIQTISNVDTEIRVCSHY